MSASLVGSEMCIRDRSPQSFHPALPGGGGPCPPRTRPKKRLRRAGAHPVSYTHLTLPTICSV
eukprot:9619157-Alexandrium_andersonii.AAC.1